MTNDGIIQQPTSKAIAVLALSFVLALAGCDEGRKEKVLDIEAPGVDIEINKVE